MTPVHLRCIMAFADLHIQDLASGTVEAVMTGEKALFNLQSVEPVSSRKHCGFMSHNNVSERAPITTKKHDTVTTVAFMRHFLDMFVEVRVGIGLGLLANMDETPTYKGIKPVKRVIALKATVRDTTVYFGGKLGEQHTDVCRHHRQCHWYKVASSRHPFSGQGQLTQFCPEQRSKHCRVALASRFAGSFNICSVPQHRSCSPESPRIPILRGSSHRSADRKPKITIITYY